MATGNVPPLVAGIELGGTKCIALLARGTEILVSDRLPTGDRPHETLTALADRIDKWVPAFGAPEALGIGSFGPIGLDRARPDYGHITATPKPGWSDTDVVGAFARLAVPIGFDTDVNGAALAEQRWGAAQGCDVAVYLTIGTGVGGGVATAGGPVHGLVHPEIGHVRLRRMPGDKFPGACPFHGDCIEGLVSGPAIAARTGVASDRLPPNHPVWQNVADELAELVTMLMLTLSPQRILIGGGVMQARQELFDPIRRRTADWLAGYVAGIDAAALAAILVPPGLGSLAGPLGTVAIACDALDPRLCPPVRR